MVICSLLSQVAMLLAQSEAMKAGAPRLTLGATGLERESISVCVRLTGPVRAQRRRKKSGVRSRQNSGQKWRARQVSNLRPSA